MPSRDDHHIQPWTFERSEELQDARIFKLARQTFRRPDSDKPAEFFVLDAPDWVNVVPVTDDGRIVFVRQYRIGTRHISLEIPGGIADGDEPVEEVAARELREETGYSASKMTFLGRSYANPAFMTNRFTAMLAEGATLTDPTAWDEHEELEIELIPAADVPELLARGAVDNSYTVLALCWYLIRAHGIVVPRP